MKKTKYSNIAPKYDKNPVRHNQPRESLIEQILGSTQTKVNILDLACGTGNYLLAQGEYYRQKSINWFGCDLSKQMLEIASKKLMNVDLCVANAESLPYKNEMFNLIACNFAFHHFQNKQKAISEMYRTLKNDGIFILKNISPEQMPLFWMYHFFPETKSIDKERFWTNLKLFDQFKKAGFNVELYTETIIKEFDIQNILKEAVNRDSSQLTLISSTEYKNGLSRVRKEMKKTYRGEFSILNLVGWKKDRV